MGTWTVTDKFKEPLYENQNEESAIQLAKTMAEISREKIFIFNEDKLTYEVVPMFGAIVKSVE
jgi:hypothetical protein